MFKEQLLYFIITYKYTILVPLAFFEGHIVSLVAGFLARMGQLNPFIATVCIAAGNLLGDTILYWVGYYKGEKIVRRWGRYFSIDAQKLARVHAIYHAHKSYILLLSKLTNGFGLATAILFTAGTMRIRFVTYMFWNAVGECIWTASLVSIGYFLGTVYVTVDTILVRAGLLMGASLLLILTFVYIRNYIKTKAKL